MKTLTHGQLFAGIGGFGLAAQWAGIDNIWANEIDPFACKVLNKNFPNTIIYEKDIRQITKETTASVDIISGGFPCQPFSQAGKRKGKDDNRYLWPEMLRIIRELKPKYIIGENVAGLLSMENGETLKTILSDLENEGYNNEVFLIPACAKGAWHRRDRLWICSYSSNNTNRANRGQGKETERVQKEHREERCTRMSGRTGATIPKDVSNTDSSRYIHRESEEQPTERGGESFNQSTTGNTHEDVPNTDSKRRRRRTTDRKDAANVGESSRCERAGSGNIESSMGGMADGVSTWMDRYWEHEPEGIPRVATGVKDRVHRLKGLGNAIVPQVAYELFKTIQLHYYY